MVQQQASSPQTDQLEDGPCPTVMIDQLAVNDAILSCPISITYAALQGATVDLVAVELANGHGGVLVGVHLDKSEATVRLEAGLGDVAKVLEEGNKVVLCGVRSKVAHVAGSLPSRSLSDYRLV